jgi:putative transposase
MKLTLQTKLVPTPEQHAALLTTMERFNAACAYMAGIAFAAHCTSKFDLQKLVYYDVRDRFKLSAQMTIRAIAKVVECYKRDPSKQVTFRPHGAMTYDERLCSFPSVDRVSLLTLAGREVMPFVYGTYQAARIDRKRGQADLVYRKGIFYLLVTIDIPEPDPAEASEYIGVDLGIQNIAATSDGEMVQGNHINNVRARFSRLRTKLQKKNTKSSKRLLRKRSGRERRFATDTNHCISKRLVKTAQDTTRGIALEDLQGIRERVTVRKRQRRVLHTWSFGQLRQFIEYKAQRDGVQVVAVDAHYTSQECSQCGHIAKANRPSQKVFKCVACGFSCHADTNAAIVISRRAAVKRPYAGVPGSSGRKHRSQAPRL